MAFSRGTPHSNNMKKSFHVATHMKCLFQINHILRDDVKRNGAGPAFSRSGLWL